MPTGTVKVKKKKGTSVKIRHYDHHIEIETTRRATADEKKAFAKAEKFRKT